MISDEVSRRFPGVPVQQASLLQYGDEPVIGPGELLLRIVLASEDGEAEPGELTPVMARLGQVDLETLDTLITAGIAPDRADALRWALARIRERPAYEQIRARAREIEELKAQF